MNLETFDLRGAHAHRRQRLLIAQREFRLGHCIHVLRNADHVGRRDCQTSGGGGGPDAQGQTTGEERPCDLVHFLLQAGVVGIGVHTELFRGVESCLVEAGDVFGSVADVAANLSGAGSGGVPAQCH